MGEIVDLKLASLIDNQDFISDMCRFQEGIVAEKAVRKKYRFDEAAWEKLNDDELVRAIEAESVRRIRDGSSKRERAQALIVKGPAILDSIASDPTANARHRIDSCKVLNDLASNGPGDTTPAADRFQIIIRLDADTTLQFDKSRAVDANDIDPYNDTGMIAALAAKKTTDGGNGDAI